MRDVLQSRCQPRSAVKHYLEGLGVSSNNEEEKLTSGDPSEAISPQDNLKQKPGSDLPDSVSGARPTCRVQLLEPQW